MNRLIFLIVLIVSVSLGGCNKAEVLQSSTAVEEEGQPDTLKNPNIKSDEKGMTITSTEEITEANAETGMRATEETEDNWKANHVEIFNDSYQMEKHNGGYAISNEEVTDLAGGTDFVFDLSDLEYDVVKALVKIIYDKNHYSSYEFYEHSMEVDMAMHQETGIEYFDVLFDSTHYWMIYYCQGKAYALYDDTGLIARARRAKALSNPGETVLFGFPIKESEEWVVICMEESNRDYLVCRMGNPKDKSITLEYPQDKSDSWDHFTLKKGLWTSKEKPKNGEIYYNESLIYEDETVIYTIFEESTRKDGGSETALSLKMGNKLTGEVKIYEGMGEMSETVGALDNHISDYIGVTEEAV